MIKISEENDTRRIRPGEWIQMDEHNFIKYCTHINHFDEKKDILFIEREKYHSEKEPISLFIVAIGFFVAGMLSGLVAIHLAVLIGNLISF